MSEQDIKQYGKMIEEGLALSEYNMLVDKASKSQNVLVGKRQVDATYILRKIAKDSDGKPKDKPNN